MDTRTPTPILHVGIAIFVGILMAVFLGQAAAAGSMSKIGMVLALGPALFLVLGLQQRVWLLIPFLSAFGGRFPFLPLPFSVSDLSIMGTFGVFVLLMVFKKLEKRGRFDFLDLLLLLNLLYLVSVFLRNPVGMNVLGTDRVGGRPYFVVVISCMLYWVFSHVTVSPKLAFRLPLIGLAGSIVVFLIWLVSYKVPGAAAVMGKFYTGVDFNLLLSEYREGAAVESAVARFSSLSDLGSEGLMCLIAYYNPLTLLSPMYFWRFLALAACGVGILMGGFRSLLLYNGVYFLTATWFRNGLIGALKASMLVVCGVLLLLVIQATGIIPVPLAAQRSLSALPIPIDWDSRAVGDAEGSSQWRFDMWKDVWENDKWIENKVLGDGFGFTRYELSIMYSSLLGSGGFMDAEGAESQKITGTFHNGPLSAIRYVGIVGLILYVSLCLGAASKAVTYIRLTRGTAFQPFAIMQIPTIFAPFFYLVVFGQFDSALPGTITAIAALKLLSRSFDDFQAAQEQKAPDSQKAAPVKEPVPAMARIQSRHA